MSPTLALTHAIAIDVRTLGSGDVVGVALIVPSVRYLSFLGSDADAVMRRDLSAETWGEIDAQIAGMAARLPFKPEPLSSDVVEAILGTAPAAPVLAQRFAAVPVTMADDDWPPLLDSLLPGLLTRRHEASSPPPSAAARPSTP